MFKINLRRGDSRYQYTQVTVVPGGLRFDVPRQFQGQTVELAFADERPYRGEAGAGSPWMRRTDRSTGAVTYARLTSTETHGRVALGA